MGYVANLPYRADADKFSLLITNKVYNSVNEHGYISRYTPFMGKYGDFIAANLTNKKEFTILASNALKEVKLDAPLVKGGATDTDDDSLSDSKEVDWLHVNTGELPYALPTLEQLWKWNQDDYDDDGLLESEDKHPFKNNFQLVWFKLANEKMTQRCSFSIFKAYFT